jgi:subtilase family serine protease
VVGPTNASTPLTVDVALKPRDEAAFDAFVNGVTTPGSPTYHHYLNAGAFGPMFGPTAGTIASVRDWLSASGLQVGETSSDGLLIPATGTTDQIERAFAVNLVNTQLPSGRLARANTQNPTVPASLASSIQGLVGLSTVAQPEPQASFGPTGTTESPDSGGTAPTAGPLAQQANASGPTPCSAATSAATSFGSYTANTIAGAYGLSSLYGQGRLGAGITVGIFELEPYLPSDVQAYETCYGISNPVTNIPVDGGAGSGAGSVEAALDIENVAGLAPGSSIKVYTGPPTSSGIDVYNTMVQSDSAQVLTTSWGLCESAFTQQAASAENTIFKVAAAQGQTIFAAAGDSGSEDCSFEGQTGLAVDDPASQPTVTGVGGTSLSLSGSGGASTETVWNDRYGAGGGGVSSNWTQPSSQTGPGTTTTPTACPLSSGSGTQSCRTVPDVSASADPAHGYMVLWKGGWVAVGGTSAGAPLWAALTAVTDQGCSAPAGLINPALYAAGSSASPSFTDVTAGNNDLLGVHGGVYAATAHYDRATGWGTPKAGSLITALQPTGGCPSVTGLSPSAGPLSGGGTVVIAGSDLAMTTSVQFGSARATVTARTANSVTVTAPPGSNVGSVPVTVTTPTGTSVVSSAALYTYSAVPTVSYWLAASDGGIFSFGAAGFFGSTGGQHLNQPIVGMATTPDGQGYWLVASDGGIFTFGDAGFFGSTGGQHLNRPIVGMAASADGNGYWLVASDGGIFTFGDAGFFGSTGGQHLNQPIVGMATTPDGQGYWLVASDGGIFTFGDAGFFGSEGGQHLNQPIVGMAASHDGKGYWLVASDGGIFALGDAGFFGSEGGQPLNRPIVGLAATNDGNGYWMVASDGGIFTFGDAVFEGSTGGQPLNKPIVGMAS